MFSKGTSSLFLLEIITRFQNLLYSVKVPFKCTKIENNFPDAAILVAAIVGK